MNFSCCVVCVPFASSICVPLWDLTGAVLVAVAAEVVPVDLATAEYETPGTGVALATASTLAFASR